MLAAFFGISCLALLPIVVLVEDPILSCVVAIAVVGIVIVGTGITERGVDAMKFQFFVASPPPAVITVVGVVVVVVAAISVSSAVLPRFLPESGGIGQYDIVICCVECGSLLD